MSWPAPAQSSGLAWPTAARPEPFSFPILQQNAPKGWRLDNRKRRDSRRKAKYAVGMGLGFLAVHLVKRAITSIPLVGSVLRPVLGLLPTIVIGPALGAALVYGYEEGDPLAARHVIREKAVHVQNEVNNVVQDIHEDLRAAQHHLSRRARQLEAEAAPLLESTARSAQRAVEEMERSWASKPQHLEEVQRALHNAAAAAAAALPPPPPPPPQQR